MHWGGKSRRPLGLCAEPSARIAPTDDCQTFCVLRAIGAGFDQRNTDIPRSNVAFLALAPVPMAWGLTYLVLALVQLGDRCMTGVLGSGRPGREPAPAFQIAFDLIEALAAISAASVGRRRQPQRDLA